jgi:acyl dehydratase
MQHYTMAQLPGMVGKELALSDWLTVDQDRIQRFAEATVDPC